jgi:streptogramin lyase
MFTTHRVRASGLVGVAAGALLALSAAPAFAETTAVVPMPSCCVDDTIDLDGSVFALSQQPPGPNPEQPTLVRIDPATDTVTGTVGLPDGTSAGNALDTSSMVAAAGSVWVIAYFENEVVRVDPASMSITAAIHVGRSPSSIVFDGNSLWVALNNDRSVVRLNPATNALSRTIKVGKQDGTDGPWQLAYDGSQLLASLPGSGRVARINPRSGAVHYDKVGFDAASCAHILPVPGGYWLDDTECSPNYFRWNAHTHRITTALDPTSDTRHDWGATVVDGALYTGEFDCDETGCTQGLLVKRDAVSGAEISEVSVGIEAMLPHFAAGSFWAADFDNGTLQRVADF